MLTTRLADKPSIIIPDSFDGLKNDLKVEVNLKMYQIFVSREFQHVIGIMNHSLPQTFI
jgi:hypothetical protein